VEVRDAVGAHQLDDTPGDVGRGVVDDLGRHRAAEARPGGGRRRRVTQVADQDSDTDPDQRHDGQQKHRSSANPLLGMTRRR